MFRVYIPPHRFVACVDSGKFSAEKGLSAVGFWHARLRFPGDRLVWYHEQQLHT